MEKLTVGEVSINPNLHAKREQYLDRRREERQTALWRVPEAVAEDVC